MFLPISPSPPRGSTRSFFSATVDHLSSHRCLVGGRDADALKRGPDRRPLRGIDGNQRQAQALRRGSARVISSAALIGIGLVVTASASKQRRSSASISPGALQVPTLRRVPDLAHLLADQVGGDQDPAGPAEFQRLEEGVIVAGEHREALDRAELIVVCLLDRDHVVDLSELAEAARAAC